MKKYTIHCSAECDGKLVGTYDYEADEMPPFFTPINHSESSKVKKKSAIPDRMKRGIRKRFDWSKYTKEELTSLCPFTKGYDFTKAEYYFLVENIEDYILRKYLLKTEGYGCHDVFETIVRWAIEDGTLKDVGSYYDT